METPEVPRRRFALPKVLVAVVIACGTPVQPPNNPDSGTTDSGVEADAGGTDSGTPTDAGPTDSGNLVADAGPTDSGTADAGPQDAGNPCVANVNCPAGCPQDSCMAVGEDGGSVICECFV